MRWIINTFTGALEAVGSGGGGGGGTVTSVAGGVGITNTPEPIVGAGTVDLDINSLTTETSLASGDLFPFVDVSVGTTPASQRKVTLGNIQTFLGGAFQPLDAGLTALSSLGAGIAVSNGADGWFARSIDVTDTATVNLTITNANGVAGNPTLQADVITSGLDHGGLGGLSDDDHTQYLLLAGRAGTANNPLISTTAEGIITGSAADFGLTLRSTTDTSTRHGLTLLDNVTRVSTSGGIFDLRALRLSPTLTIDDGCGIIGYAFGNFTEDATIWSATAGATSFTPVMFLNSHAKVRNASGETQTLALLGSVYQTYLVEANGGAFTISNAAALTDANAYSRVSSGTVAVTAHSTIDSNPDFATGVTATLYRGAWIRPTVSGGTMTEFRGIDIDAPTAGTSISLRSSAASTMRHAGNVRIGDTAAPTRALEILGHVFLDNSGTASELRFREPSASGSNYTAFKAQAQAGDVTYTLPASSTNGYLRNVASTLSWDATGAGIDHGGLGGLGDDDHTQYLLLAGRSGGQTAIGGTAASEILALQSTVNSARGTVDALDSFRAAVTAPSATSPVAIAVFPNGATVSGAGSITGVRMAGTVTYSANPSATTAGDFFDFQSTITNSGSRAMASMRAVFWRPSFLPATGTTLTNMNSLGFVSNPTYGAADTAGQTAAAVQALRVAGSVTDADWTITDWMGIEMLNPVGGAGTLTRVGGFKINDLTRGGTNYSLWSLGAGVFMAHAGDAFFGGSQATLTAPSATVHAQESTTLGAGGAIGGEVFRAETVATNSDPNYRIFHGRVATTDATATTLLSFTIPATTTVLIEARVVARRTGGALGTAEDAAAYIVYGAYKNVGGTATAVGAATPTQIFLTEDQAGFNATLDVTGATARVRVTGAASNNLTWHCTLIVQNLTD